MPAKAVLGRLDFYLYFSLNQSKKSPELLRLLNRFSRAFSMETTNFYGDWRKRLDNMFLHNGEVKERDAMICQNGLPLAVQQFSISLSGVEAYAEGIFVIPEFRGQGLVRPLRENLFRYLLERDVERFYIGMKGPVCARVRKAKSSQALAERC